jgi:hypothetical protein
MLKREGVTVETHYPLLRHGRVIFFHPLLALDTLILEGLAFPSHFFALIASPSYHLRIVRKVAWLSLIGVAIAGVYPAEFRLFPQYFFDH